MKEGIRNTILAAAGLIGAEGIHEVVDKAVENNKTELVVTVNANKARIQEGRLEVDDDIKILEEKINAAIQDLEVAGIKKENMDLNWVDHMVTIPELETQSDDIKNIVMQIEQLMITISAEKKIQADREANNAAGIH